MALYPEVQQKLRDEIHQVEKEMEERGESALTLDDLSKMRYLDAVLVSVDLMDKTKSE